jgi:hypothetical protein
VVEMCYYVSAELDQLATHWCYRVVSPTLILMSRRAL